MKSKLLQKDAQARTFAVVFDPDDEAMAGLLGFAKHEHLSASHLTAIGAFERAILGYYDLDAKEYAKIPVEEQVEVLSLVGDITLDGDEPKVHAHVVAGRRDGSTCGGHLLKGWVRPTLEVMIVESPVNLQRQYDERSGLALIRL